jgi:16S rRNA (cytosine1402-N4)-methyltransferase
MKHTTVLLNEAIDGLDIHNGEIFVDGTLGGGGHTEEVIKRFGNQIKIIGIDADSDAIKRSKKRIDSLGIKANIDFVKNNFRNMDKVLEGVKIENVDKILLDIGLSSNQFEDSGRGFSFQRDEPLIMSFKKDIDDSDLTAREILNTWAEDSIMSILKGYGEEQFAYKISKAIVDRRKIKPIETTFDLVEIIKGATPNFYHHRKTHFATKTFQALRITVNDEIESLKEGIKKSFDKLKGGGRLAVISFHSLEDRVVKTFFKQKEDEGLGKRITKKPIVPTKIEIKENPRSRSAKLRIFEKNINKKK